VLIVKCFDPAPDGQFVPLDGASGMTDIHLDEAIVKIIIARPLASPH